jgi:hypothetical protein
MPETPRAVRYGRALLGVAACVNLAAGIVISLDSPARASDLWTIYDWCRAWLFEGRSLYTVAGAATDYPPNAIVVLAPLALLPAVWLTSIWMAIALALTLLLPSIVMRASAPGRRRAAAALVVPTLLFLCWAAPRTLLQFSVLSMTLACLALLIADTRPALAGVALGLGLCKPHLAGPIALWTLITGRLRVLTIAVAVAAAGWAVYDGRIGEDPRTTAMAYWRVLESQYAGAGGLIGHANLRGWARMLTTDRATADMLWIAWSLGLLIAIGLAAFRRRSRASDEDRLAVPAMLCLWSLLVTYHNGNNFILALPAFAFLWFDERRRGAAKWLALAMLQAAMMFDVPVRLAGAAVPGLIRFAINQFDRAAILITLAYVCAIWWRRTATPAAARAAPSPR